MDIITITSGEDLMERWTSFYWFLVVFDVVLSCRAFAADVSVPSRVTTTVFPDVAIVRPKIQLSSTGKFAVITKNNIASLYTVDLKQADNRGNAVRPVHQWRNIVPGSEISFNQDDTYAIVQQRGTLYGSTIMLYNLADASTPNKIRGVKISARAAVQAVFTKDKADTFVSISVNGLSKYKVVQDTSALGFHTDDYGMYRCQKILEHKTLEMPNPLVALSNDIFIQTRMDADQGVQLISAKLCSPTFSLTHAKENEPTFVSGRAGELGWKSYNFRDLDSPINFQYYVARDGRGTKVDFNGERNGISEIGRYLFLHASCAYVGQAKEDASVGKWASLAKDGLVTYLSLPPKIENTRPHAALTHKKLPEKIGAEIVSVAFSADAKKAALLYADGEVTVHSLLDQKNK
jgi:hypothetical protein